MITSHFLLTITSNILRDTIDVLFLKETYVQFLAFTLVNPKE